MLLAIALAFSLGVHLLAFLALGLVGERTPQVRAYRWFVGAVAGWLLLALLAATGADLARPFAGAAAHLLPIVLLFGGALPAAHADRWLRPAAIAVSVALLPFTMHASPWHHESVEALYYGGAWSLAGARIFGVMRTTVPARHAGRWMLVMALLVLGAVAIGLLGGLGAIAAIALLTATIQSVVLYATVRLSLYAVRAEAGRTGALVTGAAEHDRRAIAGEIAAMVAHEVRNPLTGVRSLAQRLADGEVPEARRRRYADLIVREVDRVERMVSALLGASARRGPADGGETDVPRLFDDLALLVAGHFRRAGVQLAVEPVPIRVPASPEPLAQALLNLLLNAVQQAPLVRQVRLGAREAQGADGASIELLVQDDGRGVPAGERSAIFSPFHSGTGGSGLGLAVVRRLCDEQGWTIAVRDTPGGGATFALGVPSRSRAHDADSGDAPDDVTRAPGLVAAR